MNQFGAQNPGSRAGGMGCAECEAMLTDAIDGLLTPELRARFDLHLLGCEDCAMAFEDAQRGAAWLEMLKSDRPEPTVDLMARILAQTSGVQAAQPAYVPAVQPVLVQPIAARWSTRITGWFNLKGFGQSLLQPRLAMTAAMAFFSIALTLNLVGVRITDLKASDLSPSSLKRTLYQTNARVVRYYDNLRVVYELESRVRELRQDDEAPAQNQNNGQKPQQQNQQKNEEKRPRNGSSRKENLRPSYVLTAQLDPRALQYYSQGVVPTAVRVDGKTERGTV
ncbi:zf-HC2 domain-containing protein [Terriglobus tenax]|uniref:zf-HC2 domain-containing protein n=1 Tax=Terriglobus tenax TaxID=1111115 RepID=UPI0021E0BC7E|nr:zf-HC2 domain-containing protein [Terriglobus tenax]